MSHDIPENEPINVSDPEIKENTWAHDRERHVRSEYRDGMSIVEGEVIEGEHVGHRWLRIEGGSTIDAERLEHISIGGQEMSVESFSFHHASIVLEQGQGAGKDPRGFNSIKAEAVVSTMPEQYHSEEELQSLSEGEDQRDDQGRVTSRVRHTGDGKVIAEETSYLDDEGVQITTGLHRTGPEQGKIYETRRLMKPETGTTLPLQYQTPRGAVENLRVTSMTMDIRAADAVREQAGETPTPQPRKVWLELQGHWTGQ